MKGNSIAVVLAAALLAATLASAQNQPIPKPVSPPSPNPANATPPDRNSNPLIPTPGAPVPAQTTGGDAALAPFIDNQTIGVLRVDLKDMDLPAIQDWISGAVDELRKTSKEVARARSDVHEELGKAFNRVEKLRLAGVDRLYMVLSLSDFPEDRPPFVVVPLRSGADAKALENALTEAFGSAGSAAPVARTLGNAVVFAAPATFDRLKTATAEQRPDLSLAFDAAGKAQIRIALIPQESARKAMESVVTNLPNELGGGSVKTVSRGLSWTSIAISLPPDPSLKIVIQATDANDAAKLNEIINRAIAWAAQRKTGPPEELAFTGMLASLKPRLQGDRIAIDLSPDDTRKLAATMAGEMIRARTAASRTLVMSNLRQLSVGVVMYADDHQGALPKDLGSDLDKYLGPNSRQLWIDPLRPNDKKPYVYLRLADKLADVNQPASAIMIYENHTTWDNGINAAFADGHAEWFANEKQFKDMLDQTKKNNPQAVEMPQ